MAESQQEVEWRGEKKREMQFSIRAGPRFLAFISPCNSPCYSARMLHSHPRPAPRLFVDLLITFILLLCLGATPLGETAEDVQYRRINKPEETSKQEASLGAATEPIRGVWLCGSGRLEAASRLKPRLRPVR